MWVLWVVVVAVVIGLWVLLMRRLRRGDATAGGSHGWQMRRKKDDWGPQS